MPVVQEDRQAPRVVPSALDRYKWYEDGQLELFNLRDDLSEKKNLAAENPAKVRELHAKLVAWRQEVKAIMPTPNPDWTGQVEAKKQGK